MKTIALDLNSRGPAKGTSDNLTQAIAGTLRKAKKALPQALPPCLDPGGQSLAGLTFDDVMIRPALTDVRPDQVNLATEVIKGVGARLPVIAAPMTTVFSKKLAAVLAQHGAVATLPRELALDQLDPLLRTIREYPDGRNALVIGTSSPFHPDRIRALLDHPLIDALLLDTVAGHNVAVFRLLDTFDASVLARVVCGNIATAQAARDYCQYPIAGLRVGLGPGSICTTTQVTGVGMPQLAAIQEVASVAQVCGIPVIADGGICSTGDIAKALAAGANSVMMGRLFAQTTEAPGKIRRHKGETYKFYAGAEYASIELKSSGDEQLDEEIHNLLERNHRSEGVSGYVRHIGSARVLLEVIERALKASFAFVGARDLTEFQNNARFAVVSAAAQRQAGAHNIDRITSSNKVL